MLDEDFSDMDLHSTQWADIAILSRIPEPEYYVRVSDPIKEQTGLMSWHYKYTIKSNLFSSEVTRRFSDLEWLHFSLSESYLGLGIPKLPAKHIKYTMTEEDILERKEKIQEYLAVVLKHPVLGKSVPFKVFLTYSYENLIKVQETSNSNSKFSYGIMDLIKVKTTAESNQVCFTSEIAALEIESKLMEVPLYALYSSLSQWINFEYKKDLVVAFFPKFTVEYNHRMHEPLTLMREVQDETKSMTLQWEALDNAFYSSKESLVKYNEGKLLAKLHIEKNNIREAQEIQEKLAEFEVVLNTMESNLSTEFERVKQAMHTQLDSLISKTISNQLAKYNTESKFWKQRNNLNIVIL